MTTKELARLLGREGTWVGARNGLLFRVRIADARDRGWGRTDVLVRPVAGSGEAWVDIENINLDEEE